MIILTIGENQSRIESMIRNELRYTPELSGRTVELIAKAVAKAIAENNRKIERELT